MYLKPDGDSDYTFEWWIGRGQPLSPYLKGFIIEFMLSELRPNELRVAPDELRLSAFFRIIYS